MRLNETEDAGRYTEGTFTFEEFDTHVTTTAYLEDVAYGLQCIIDGAKTKTHRGHLFKDADVGIFVFISGCSDFISESQARKLIDDSVQS